MPEKGLVSVIIVNYNTRELLLACVQSVLDNAGEVPVEIIVVDNASHDGSAEALSQNYPDVTLISSSKNLGFSAANNLAFSKSNGEFILVLNPDTVMPRGSLGELVDFLKEHKDVGIVAPQLVGKDDRPQISSFGMFPGCREAFVRAFRLWRIIPHSSIARNYLVGPGIAADWCYTGHLLGACMLIRRHVWQLLKGMDERFFLFLEETDFCLRARNKGWPCAYTLRTHIVHYGEQSMGRILDISGGLYIRSYNKFCKKHNKSIFSVLAANAMLVAGNVISSLIFLLRDKDPHAARQSLAAVWYGYFKQPKTGD